MHNDSVAKFGFVEDNINTYLNELKLHNNAMQFSEVHVDVYPKNPLDSSNLQFELMLRIDEKNALVRIDNDRIVVQKNNMYGTHLLNVLISNIKELYSKTSDDYIEFILNIHNVYYRVIIIIN